jgi:hypothetical protein
MRCVKAEAKDNPTLNGGSVPKKLGIQIVIVLFIGIPKLTF